MKNINLHFFDGESINNKYVLLSNESEYTFNPSGITAKEGLDFLYNNGLKSYNYFFRIEYDLNMLLKEERFNDDFFKGEEIELYGYKLLYFSDKMLIINNRVKFYDVSSLFNKSFLETIKRLEITLTSEENELLTKYKKIRDIFNIKDIKNIIEYNKTECRIGIKIIERLKEIIPKELFTYKMYGSSAITNKFLSNQKIKGVVNFSNLFMPEEIFNFFFGGRMESFKIGTFHNVYKYDINSAYPSIIKSLREITGIEKKKYLGEKIEGGFLYKIKMKINNNKLIGLLPVRIKSGYIIYPEQIEGFYFGVEVLQVLEYQKKYNIDLDIYEYYKFNFGKKLFPNNVIEKIYLTRKKLKEEKNPQHYIYKILLNSIYGKFCQQVGKPQFQNFYYASFITSSIRAKLLEVVINNPFDVIFFATDGILTKKKLNIKIDYNLGDWEYIEIKKGVVLLSGVYELKDNKGNIYKGMRGYKFNFPNIIKQIKLKGFAEVPVNGFIGIKYFNKNYKAFKGNKCKFITITKKINPYNQIKRLYLLDKKFILTNEYNSYLLNYSLYKDKIIYENKRKNSGNINSGFIEEILIGEK